MVTVAPNGGYAAVRHLLDLGHRRVALIGGPPAPGQHRPAKAGGYLQALAEAGIDVDEALIVPGDYTREGGAAAMQRLLATPRPPTAVFAGNDLMAIGALAVARRSGRRVPQDVAMVGYDDIPEAATTVPALTTVRVPKYEMGLAAAGRLLERLRARHPLRDGTPATASDGAPQRRPARRRRRRPPAPPRHPALRADPPRICLTSLTELMEGPP